MSTTMSSKNIGHMGIVSTMVKEIGIVNIIDEIIGVDPRQKVSCGAAVLAMVLNMLSIFQRPLYLTVEFLKDKPVDRLIHPGLETSDFNDDVLGRTLDKLFSAGLESIFLRIASAVGQKYTEFMTKFLHCDTTSMSVHGEYNHGDREIPIEITYGYSKDGRPDLKQFIISMITCNSLPIFLTTLSGNTSDRVHFKEMIQEYGQQIKEALNSDNIFVFDSAFYNEPTLIAIGSSIKWITRVSERINYAKQLLEETEESSLKDCSLASLKGYKLTSSIVNYAGLKQRWIIVSSEKAYKREKKTVLKNVAKEKETIRNQCWHFSNKTFTCKGDGLKQAKMMAKKWKYHQLEDIQIQVKYKRKNGRRGRPKNNEKMIEVYSIQIDFELSVEKLEKELTKKGRFIIATNLIEEQDELSDESVLQAYKDQQYVERGFRFLKDPMFFVDAVYLEKEERIMAMAMLLGVSLLIYSLCEKRLRKVLVNESEIFFDPFCKQTSNPTIRRVFQVFEGIHVVYIKEKDEIREELVLNLENEHKQVLRLLGKDYEQIYSSISRTSSYQDEITYKIKRT